MTGRKHSAAPRAKISEAMMGKKRSAKMSEAMTGKKRSAATLDSMRSRNLGFGEIICNILEGSLGGRFLILIRDVVHIGVRRVLL
jgi:hypothetical protein